MYVYACNLLGKSTNLICIMGSVRLCAEEAVCAADAHVLEGVCGVQCEEGEFCAADSIL